MKGFGIVVALLAATVGCEGQFSETDPDGRVNNQKNNVDNNGPNNENNVVRSGLELYTSYCLSCHGEGATGTPIWPASIEGFTPIETIVLQGKGTMAALPIPVAEVAAIQEYLISLGTPDWSGLTGEEVFAAGCESCHGAQGVGNDIGPALRFRDAEFFDYVTRSGRPASEFAHDMPAFSEERITDQQMAEMIAWIDEQPNETSGQGLYVQFCVVCHGADGRSGSADKDIAGEGIANVVRSGKEDEVSANNYMPAWSDVEITDAEITLMQSYLDSL